MIEWLSTPDVLVLVASADDTGAPAICRSLGIRALADRRFAIYLPVPEAMPVLDLIAAGQPIAVTAGRARDYKSWQLKAAAAAIARTAPEDEAWVARYLAEVPAALAEAGVPPELTVRLFSPAFVVVTFAAAEVFEQTPGARAGTPVTP